ncbi:P-loop containing nucleoside triphosphate hydrolase protein [Lipomyces japonicus]|uniref:P-loop containing nucleoside triphosphate hydrolase protein n=1 Tax=Lipomyces japonicus TaxID=56871 RepID=UPI0034CD9FB0
MSSSSLADQVRKAAPSIDSVVSEYCAGYVSYLASSSASAAANVESEVTFVRDLLVNAGASTRAVTALAQNLLAELVPLYKAKAAAADHGNSAVGSGTSGSGGGKLLDQALVIGAQRDAMSSVGLFGTTIDLDAVGGRKVDSRVDKKKLEKAERKIQAKLEKRAIKNVEYEASKLINAASTGEDYDEFFLKVNPLQLGNGGGANGGHAKSKDIKIDNFDLYVGAGQRILSDTSLTLAYGRRYGLIGQNGIGKSTLLRALARRELSVPKHITILHVEQEVLGDDTPALQSVLDADVWRKRLLKDQDSISKQLAAIDDQLNELPQVQDGQQQQQQQQLENDRAELDATLNEVFAKLTDIEADKAESRAATILFGLGFSAAQQHNPTNSFSGGWRMRLALARALFCKPDLLLLDEPSNMLDVPSITFLSQYLQGYPSTVLVVSHDRAFLNEIATDIIHQHSERLDYYKNSNFDMFYATREERRKNQKREYENQMAYRKHLQGFIDKFRYNAAKSQEAQSRIKKLEKLPILEPPEEDQTLTFRFPEVEKLSPPIIQLENVSFSYDPTKRTILSNVDLSVQLDSRIALVGANGSGKTTLLKVLTGQAEPTKGMVQRNARLRIGYFAQHHVDSMDLNLSAVAWMAKTWPGKSEEEYRRHLGAFGITGTLGLQKMQLLSGGQKSRVAFACLGLNNPHILVLDEPSNHLDTAGLDALAEAINKFEGGVLLVSHDVTMINRTTRQLWVCDDGSVTQYHGDIEQYKRDILAKADSSGVVQKH